MKANDIETILKQALPHTLIQVSTKDQVHFEALVVSEAFIDQSRINRQRKVYSVLNPFIQSGEIHALALKTLTPAEWQQEEKNDR